MDNAGDARGKVCDYCGGEDAPENFYQQHDGSQACDSCADSWYGRSERDYP